MRSSVTSIFAANQPNTQSSTLETTNLQIYANKIPLKKASVTSIENFLAPPSSLHEMMSLKVDVKTKKRNNRPLMIELPREYKRRDCSYKSPRRDYAAMSQLAGPSEQISRMIVTQFQSFENLLQRLHSPQALLKYD